MVLDNQRDEISRHVRAVLGTLLASAGRARQVACLFAGWEEERG
jgi:hypothetical protein